MRRALGVLVLFAVACGDDDGNGPSDSIAGEWELSVTVSGDGVTCSFNDVPMELEQEDDEIEGTYGPGTLTCTGPGGTASEEGSGEITGDIDGEDVEFNLDNANFRHEGTLDDDEMEGEATWIFEDATLTGEWSADRD